MNPWSSGSCGPVSRRSVRRERHGITLTELKAHRLDSPETTNRPHISSILDDTFYLLKLVISRVLSCGSITTLRSMRTRIFDVMENDYNGMIRRKMEGVYSQQTTQEKDRGKERDMRSAFVVSFRLYARLSLIPSDILERPGRVRRLHGPPHRRNAGGTTPGLSRTSNTIGPRRADCPE